MTFAEEFPHLTSLGNGCIRFFAGAVGSFLAVAFSRWFGASEFLTGWFACTAFYAIRYAGRL